MSPDLEYESFTSQTGVKFRANPETSGGDLTHWVRIRLGNLMEQFLGESRLVILKYELVGRLEVDTICQSESTPRYMPVKGERGVE